MKVRYSVSVRNPDYRYGDLNKKPWLELIGTGEIVHYSADGQNATVVDDATGKFHSVLMDNLRRASD